MTRHAYMYLCIFSLAYCWVSSVQAVGGKNSIAFVSRGRRLLSDLGPGEQDLVDYHYLQRQQKCGPYLGLDTNGRCPYCLTNHCYQCSADYKVCTVCMKGYELNNGSCRKCNTTMPFGADFCNGSCNTSNCSACFPGHILTEKRTCTYCYGLYNGSSCENCDNCDRCIVDTSGKLVCTQCQADEYPENVFDLVNGTCVNQCSLNSCISCSRDNNGKFQCLDCLLGSALDKNNVCVDCTTTDENCMECSWKGDKMKCTDCFSGYQILNNGSCHQCPPKYNCTFCANTTKNDYVCTECDVETTLLPNGRCQDCEKGCFTCEWKNNKLMCNECSLKYGFLNGRCRKCPNDCDFCSEKNGALVCDCEDGDFLSKNGSCVSCNDRPRDLSCTGCSEDLGTFECTMCQKDAYHTKLDTCISCIKNAVGCRDCERASDGTFNCVTCKDDFTMVNGVCKLCSSLLPNCDSCNVDDQDKPSCYGCRCDSSDECYYFYRGECRRCTACPYFSECEDSEDSEDCSEQHYTCCGFGYS